MKKLFKLVLALVVLSLFAACSKSAKDENVTLKFSWWGSESRHKALMAVTEQYMKENPKVKIEVEYGAFDGYESKLLTQLSGRTEADIMQVNYGWLHSFGKGQNVFYDLNKVKNIVALDNWAASDLKGMTVGGQVAAVPHGVTARANIYNTVLFKENGLTFPATYDDIITAAKVIGAKNTENGSENKYVITNIGDVSLDLFIAQMLYDQTGKVMFDETGKVNYTPEQVAVAFNKYLELEKSGATPTIHQADPIQNESNPVWTSGRSGAVYEWIGTAEKYMNSYKGGGHKEEIAVAPYLIDATSKSSNIYVKPSLTFAISKNTKHPEEAAKFIQYLFTNEEAVKTIGMQLGVSSNKVTREIQVKNNIVKGAMKTGYEMLANYPTTMLNPYFEDSNVRGARYDAIAKIRNGKDVMESAKEYITNQETQMKGLMK